MIRYDRRVLELTDVELEQFIREWVGRKHRTYVEVTTFGGPGDRGRDVVGFCTTAKHQGDWHNYQCKQFGRNLSTGDGLRELGKILYYAYKGEFSAPSRYVFVAPRGVNRNLERLIFNPSDLRDALIANWAQHCLTQIEQGSSVSLDAGLRKFIESYNFENVTRLTIKDILDDPDIEAVLHKWFGKDLGTAPVGKAPKDVQTDELPYVKQLVDAYGDSCGKSFADHIGIDAQFTLHFQRQRERFYDAAYFKRFYRDSTEQAVLDAFENDIFHGVIDVCAGTYSNALARHDSVMAQAANVVPAGPLAAHARVPVKQGVCHHFANDHASPRLRWKP